MLECEEENAGTKGFHMNRFVVPLAALVVLGVAGCAQTPEQAIDRGHRFNFTSALTPYSAAICISRNANARGGGVSGEERMLGEADMEVVVRDSPGTGGDTLAVAQIRRGNPISSVTVSVTTSVRGDRQAFARQLMAGC
jgi:hypothetical protein